MQRLNMKMCEEAIFDLGEKIKEARALANYSQRDLSDASGVSFTCIKMLEQKSAKNVTIYTLIALSNSLPGLNWHLPKK